MSGIGVKALIFNGKPNCRSKAAESGQGPKFSHSGAVYKDIMQGLGGNVSNAIGQKGSEMLVSSGSKGD